MALLFAQEWLWCRMSKTRSSAVGMPFFSIVVPVHNGGRRLARCLQSIHRSDFDNWELIVVDDGSTDATARLAEEAGAHVIQTGGRYGPALARNLGARVAAGEFLFFTDADCELHPDTLSKAARTLKGEPRLDALFGSYDDAPAAANFTSQYKNLFHHYVHQRSGTEAGTFWTGCGAIRRSTFLALGGFDSRRYRRPSVEDIDLGYRLAQAGGRIWLAKQVQVKHLKRWTLTSLLKSDVLDRGIPWTRLMLRYRAFTADLNLQTHNRISVIAVSALLLSVLASLKHPQAAFSALLAGTALLWLNGDLYRFFWQKRGLAFTLRAVAMHWLYYAYNAVVFGAGLLIYAGEQAQNLRFALEHHFTETR